MFFKKYYGNRVSILRKKHVFLRKKVDFFHQKCRNKCDFIFAHGFKKSVNFAICDRKSSF